MVMSMKQLIIIVTLVWLMKVEAWNDDNARHRHRHHHVLTSRKSHDMFKIKNDENDAEEFYRRGYEDLLPYNHRYRANPRFSDERRNFRLGSRGHKTYSRLHRSDYNPRVPSYDYDLSEEDDYDDYDRLRWSHHRYHQVDNENLPRWRNFPGHRRDDYFYGSRFGSRKEWRRNERRKQEDNPENDDDDDWVKGIMKMNGSKGNDEEDIWNDDDLFDDEDDEDEDEDESDDFGDGESGSDDLDGDGDATNDNNDDNPPYKTYDDIIKSLTSDDTKSLRTSVKRDYRNIEIEKYLKRDAYGNLKYQPKYNLVKKQNSGSNNRYFSYKKNTVDDVKKGDFFSKDEYVNDRHSDIQADKEYADDEMSEDETSVTSLTSSTVKTPGTFRTINTQRDTRSYNTTSVYNTVNSHKYQPSKTTPAPNKSGKSAEIREALQHAMKVSREGSCQWPRARVIPVRDVYPSPSTTYIPHCAILHRCSDDTGCCRSEALTCVPKQSHKVELYFYTTSIEGTSVVEKLSFYNHTECECREKSEYGMANDAKLDVKPTVKHQQSPPENIRRPPPKKLCKCPSEFTPRITLEGECKCGCFENAQLCVKARLGKVFFSLADRVCIQNKKCAMPDCEYGDYVIRQGKCPRKKDKFDMIANYPSHINHRIRS